MIFGDCAYCGAPFTYLIPPDAQLPALHGHDCEECGGLNVCLASRVEPLGWTLDGAKEHFADNPSAMAAIASIEAEEPPA